MKTAAAADRRLEDYLRSRGHQGAAVEVLAGDASTRRYYRVSGPEPRCRRLRLSGAVRSPTSCRSASCSGCCSGWGIPTPRIEDEDRSAASWCSRTSATARCSRCSPTRPHRKVLALYTDRHRRPRAPAARGGPRPADTRPASTSPSTSRSSPGSCTIFWKHFLEGLRERDLSVEDRAALGRRASIACPRRSPPGRACSATATSTAAT